MRAVSRLARTSAAPSRVFAAAILAELAGVLRRVTSASAADVDPQFIGARVESRFNAPITDVVIPDECQSIPITPSVCLEPERIAEAGEKRGAPVVGDDRLGDRGAERRHPFSQPRGHAAAMQREIGNP